MKTATVAQQLLDTESSKVLLHGDIHHTNILQSSDRGWLAIDPQPFYGEQTYDFANSFFNPDNMPDLVESKDRIREMASVYADRLKVSEKRILQFAFAHGGLSSAWQLEDGQIPERRPRLTEIIGKLL